MVLSFVIGLWLALLLILLPGLLLLGEDREFKRLLVAIVVSYGLLVLILLVKAMPCETVGICS
jgi:predicted histidine transporter YuiF (NhaC family)